MNDSQNVLLNNKMFFSVLGLSTNFVVFAHLPSKLPQDYWISKGSALLCGLGE